MKENYKKSNIPNKILKFNTILNIFLFSLIILAVLYSCQKKSSVSASDVLVIINSNSSKVKQGTEKLVPYLNHFGINFETIDLSKDSIPSTLNHYSLAIIAHSEITANSAILVEKMENLIEKGRSDGTGLLSFDPLMPSDLLSKQTEVLQKDTDVGTIRFSDEKHYITDYRKPGETKELFGYMSVPKMSVKKGQTVITGNNFPLLVVSTHQKGKVVQWTSQDWMYYSILGPLGGLDDCLWKSIVWAARKPFVMQALPPIATFRVDDVVGSGRQRWDASPFQWVKIANKYGFKPWLGLFNYNLTPEGIEELKEILTTGMATATPHAFGRPPRKESEIETIVNIYNPYYAPQMASAYFIPKYWYPRAIPYLSNYYDEFIFFDHNNQKSWTDETAQKIFEEIETWYQETGLPMGKYLVPHWGEISSNMMSYLHDKWDIEFTSIREVDKSWRQQTPEYRLKKGENPVRSAPFRLYDETIIGKAKEGTTTSRSSYNIDFKEFNGYEFFDFSSIINDITGYEWMPDNNVDSTANRGIKTLARGLEAKALAVLFTHETDYVYNIELDNWDKILKKISDGISIYNPVLLTIDDALFLLRAFYTSEIQSCIYYNDSNEFTINMSGKTDVPTSVYIYTDVDGEISEELVKIPAFQNYFSKTIQLSN